MSEEDNNSYEVIIVGAGVQGSSTAYYLANKLGVNNVLLLDKFAAGNSRGSSAGKSRNTRSGYGEPTYVHMMKEAHQMWRELEAQTSTKLYLRCGYLQFSCQGNSGLQSIVENLSRHAVPHSVFSGSKANEMYAEQLSLPKDYCCEFEDDGGVLLVAAIIQAYQQLFLSAGGKFKEEHEVTDIIPGHKVKVVTTKGTFQANKLVITSGPWSTNLLKMIDLEIPLKVLQNTVLYWKVKSPHLFSPDNFPAFAWLSDDNKDGICSYYGIPVLDYPDLIKICRHGGQELINVDNSEIPMDMNSIKETSKSMSRFFKGVDGNPSVTESCKYTMTPDTHPVLDKHPLHSNIVIGAGFSGHGFKLSPVVGKILSELCMGLETSYDLSLFSIRRFESVCKQ